MTGKAPEYEALVAAREMASKDTAEAMERVYGPKPIPMLEIPPDVADECCNAMAECVKFLDIVDQSLALRLGNAWGRLEEAIDDSEAIAP